MTSEFSAEDNLRDGGRLSDQEEEEDEALSLSDLPLNLINENNHDDQNQSSEEPSSQVKETQDEEFNFGSWGGSLSMESEMCAADDVFFKGQILPLRCSVSSESGLTRLIQHDLSHNSTTSCLSRSESMDHLSSIDRLTSVNSSRSSSSRSHNSSSTTTTTTFTTTTTRTSKPRMIRNQFHTYPSPKPQIRVSTSQLRRNTSGNWSQKSTVWDFFRLGLVRTPEIALQDLKVRNNNIANKRCVSRNSSSGSGSSSNSSSSIKNYNKQDLKTNGKKQSKKQNLLDKKMGLFSGCKCSITAVETVPLNNIVMIKSESEISNSRNRINNGEISGMEKKLKELKIKQKIKEKQQGKQAMSRHRTSEWLNELSHASFVDGGT